MADVNQAYRQLRGVPKESRPRLVETLGLSPEEVGQIDAMARSDSTLGLLDRTSFFPWAGTAGKEMLGKGPGEPSLGDVWGGGANAIGSFMGTPFRTAQSMATRSNPNASQAENDAWKFGWNLLATPANVWDLSSRHVGQPVSNAIMGGLGGLGNAIEAGAQGVQNYMNDYTQLPAREFQAQRGGSSAAPASGDASKGLAMADASAAQGNPLTAALAGLVRDAYPGLALAGAAGNKTTVPLGAAPQSLDIPPRPDPGAPPMGAYQDLAAAGAPQQFVPTTLPAPPAMAMPGSVDLSGVEKWLAAAAPTAPDQAKIDANANELALLGLLGGIATGGLRGGNPLSVLFGGLGGGVEGLVEGKAEGRKKQDQYTEDQRAYARMMASSGLDIARLRVDEGNARNQVAYQNARNAYDVNTQNIVAQDNARQGFLHDQSVWRQNAAKIGVDMANLDYQHRQAVADNQYNNSLIEIDNRKRQMEAAQPDFKMTDGGMLMVTRTVPGADGKPQRVMEISNPLLVNQYLAGKGQAQGLGALTREAEFMGAKQSLAAKDPLSPFYYVISELQSKGLLGGVFKDVLDSDEYNEAGNSAMQSAVGASQDAMEKASAAGKWGFLATLLAAPGSPFLGQALAQLGYPMTQPPANGTLPTTPGTTPRGSN